MLTYIASHWGYIVITLLLAIPWGDGSMGRWRIPYSRSCTRYGRTASP